MFIVLLRLTARRDKAPEFMAGHKRWLDQGYQDGVFALSGSLSAGAGGMLLVYNTNRVALEQRLAEDPFVAQDIVSVEIIEAAPGRVDERLQFIAAEAA